MRETPKAVGAYADYEAMGEDRSLSKLAQKYGKNTSYVRQLERWSSEHNWQGRLLQAEQKRQEERRVKRTADLERMDDEQALIGRTQTLRLVRHVETLIADERFGATATVAGIKIFSDMERVARGAATARLEQTGKDGGPIQVEATEHVTIDPRLLTSGELGALKLLAESIKRREEEGLL